MSDYEYDGWSFGDPCVECGDETSAVHRRYCDACWRELEGWDDDGDRCDKCDRPLVELDNGSLVCPNPYCTSRGAA